MAGLNAKKVKSTGGHRQEAIDAGSYPARVVQIIDLGVQPQRPHQGKTKPPVQMIRITYEFVDEFCLDEAGEEQLDKPRWVSEDIPFYSLDADRAKSTLCYKALDPEDVNDGDFEGLIDTPCNVTITKTQGKGKNSDKEYNNISAVSGMRPKDRKKCEPLVNEPVFFSIDSPVKDDFDKLSDYVKDKIKEGLEFEGSPLDKLLKGLPVDEEDDQEPPFDEDIPEEVGELADEDDDEEEPNW